MPITYTILNEGTILFNKEDQSSPFLIQTSWPNGQPWSSLAEMNSWAKFKIAELENETAPLAPKGPGEVGKNKPTNKSLKDTLDAVKLAETLEDYNAAKTALSELHA